MARKRRSLRWSARSRLASPQVASAISASMAAEVRSVRKAMRAASPCHGANTARSVAPAMTSSGKPRTGSAEISTRSFTTGLVVQPMKRASRSSASATSGFGKARPRAWRGSGTRVTIIPLRARSVMKPPSPTSIMRYS